MTLSRSLTAAAILALAPPLAAQTAPADHGVADPNATPITVTARSPDGITPRQRRVPPQLSPAEAAAYARIFRDIDAGSYAAAEAGLANQSSTGLL